MLIARRAQATLERQAKGFPVCTITGPRQSGKSTLCRMTFPGKPVVSLEDLDEAEHAQRDPRGFLAAFPDGAVIDEVQRVPDLLRYLQGVVDADPRPGRWILTGSAQLDLLAGITQSLAGRTALLTLLPFSWAERPQEGSLDEVLLRGSYPSVVEGPADPGDWLNAYLATYVERDVRQILNVRDLETFRLFVRLCAGHVGQLVDFTALGASCGITGHTARSWLDALRTAYLIHVVQPHHVNFNKRMVKRGKLYFLDCGLAARLLGIRAASQLRLHPSRGALFENWVITEWLKHQAHRGDAPHAWFWRDHQGLEVDLLRETPEGLQPIEVKSGATIASDWTVAVRRFVTLASGQAHAPAVIHGGDRATMDRGVRMVPWRDIARFWDAAPGTAS